MNKFVIVTLVALIGLLVVRIFRATPDTPYAGRRIVKSAKPAGFDFYVKLNQKIPATEKPAFPQPDSAPNAFDPDAGHPNIASGYEAVLTDKLPSEAVWQSLLSLKYDVTGDTYAPVFSQEILPLHNQPVTVSGFMYPLEESNLQGHFVLSYYPISQCFFCGKAGPESVVEVFAAEPLPVQQQKVTLRGRLRLNKDDDRQLFYTLNDARLVQR